ncbi:MAG: TRAP transporter large permease subunit [Candidatus Rokubacteria bacterium]|nr:TRAP transporter large permease subunit [Candidatus Rokubacteria bacterium]
MTGGELLGIIMLTIMIGVIFIGFPIAFTLLLLALAFGYFGLGAITFDLAYFQAIGLMKEQIFAAVPLFIFMGYVVEQAGLMERLFRAVRDALAPLKGALYIAVILTATIFAMATGIVGAAVTVLGIMAAPIMIKSGYSPRLSAGAIAAGGTLGILIPPSVMLIVMGPVINVSVAQLYAASFGPGFLLACMYIAYCLLRSFLNPRLGPPVPLDERPTSAGKVLWELVVGVLPLGALIASTLGTIMAGLVTPTEAAAMGASGAILLTILYGRFTLKGLKQAAYQTCTTASMVLFLAVASNVFGAVFSRLGSATVVTNAMIQLPLPPFGMLLLVQLLIFLLGWPFEWPAIILVFLPIFWPVIEALKFDPVWVGVLIAVNLQTAFLSPPVAMSAYYLKSVVPQWDLRTIYGGMADFMIIQVIGLVLVMLFPQIALWFPGWLFG